MYDHIEGICFHEEKFERKICVGAFDGEVEPALGTRFEVSIFAELELNFLYCWQKYIFLIINACPIQITRIEISRQRQYCIIVVEGIGIFFLSYADYFFAFHLAEVVEEYIDD